MKHKLFDIHKQATLNISINKFFKTFRVPVFLTKTSTGFREPLKTLE